MELGTEGVYSVTVSQQMHDTQCSIYLIAPIDKLVMVTFIQKAGAYSCDSSNSKIETFDSWVFYDHSFPAIDDPGNKFLQRKKKFCEPNTVTTFSYNAGMIVYRLKYGGGFIFKLEFIHNPTPCSIFIPGSENSDGKIRLDYNQKIQKNCTIYILQTPMTKGRFQGLTLQITSIKMGHEHEPTVSLPYSVCSYIVVGNQDLIINFFFILYTPTSLSPNTKCHRFSGITNPNFVEIGGWGDPPGFHSHEMTVSVDFCSRSYCK